jgi:hypothetical protein
MNEPHLIDLLERTGNAVPVPPAPVHEMVASARRSRRTRTWSLVGASSVAAAVVVALAVFIPTLTGSGNNVPEPLNTGAIPAGTRLVGIGHVAVAVPQSWATNKLYCGTPQKDTVIIDTGAAVEACAATRPKNVDSVLLTSGEPKGVSSYRDVSVSGVAAKAQDVGCTDRTLGHVLTCSAAVYIPSEDVTVRVGSSTSADVVDRLLRQIYVLPDEVAVPGFMSINNAHATANYQQRLDEAGLVAEIRFVRGTGWPPGFVSTTSPVPGQMVAPGTQVKVDVASTRSKQTGQAQLAEQICNDALGEAVSSATVTTVRDVRHYTPGGPAAPGEKLNHPAKDEFSDLPAAAAAAWCWTTSPGSVYTAYAVGPGGELQQVAEVTGGAPPSGEPVLP